MYINFLQYLIYCGSAEGIPKFAIMPIRDLVLTSVAVENTPYGKFSMGKSLYFEYFIKLFIAYTLFEEAARCLLKYQLTLTKTKFRSIRLSSNKQEQYFLSEADSIYKSCPSRSISFSKKSTSFSVTAAEEMMFRKKLGRRSSGW
ncbi:hypothetical protein HUJ04_004679 [Dendroctonus ponderosae]|nr:hypothetical protein HUJ04_004679 [Dendroctonus ponderosae]